MNQGNVETVMAAYVQALATQSWDAAEEFFHDNATVIFAEGTYYGKEQVGAAIHKTFSLIRDENFAVSELRWTIKSERFASCTFIYEWSGTINGKRFTSPGRGTILWVHDSGWRIINEHFGPLPR
jgi:hypothetical protein